MAATTTRSMSLLAEKLARDFPDFEFRSSDQFAWNPIESVVYYDPSGSPARLLHELGHALLGHQSYKRDIQLVRMEGDAWKKARKLAAEYSVSLKINDTEEHLYSYRDWLHARSTCPSCSSNGVQINDNHYKCIECQAVWRVNEARTCGLKRYAESSKNTP